MDRSMSTTVGFSPGGFTLIFPVSSSSESEERYGSFSMRDIKLDSSFNCLMLKAMGSLLTCAAFIKLLISVHET